MVAPLFQAPATTLFFSSSSALETKSSPLRRGEAGERAGCPKHRGAAQEDDPMRSVTSALGDDGSDARVARLPLRVRTAADLEALKTNARALRKLPRAGL